MKHLKLFSLLAAAVFIGFFSSISVSQINVKPIKLENNILQDQGEFLEDIMARVKKDYVDEKSDQQLAEAAASGILSSLDPHSSYLDEASLKEMQVQTRGEFGGLGIEITTELSVIKVVAAIEDTPAFKAGVKSGDYIIKVDGKSIVDLPIDKVVKKLRGKPGTKVTITIVRKGEKAPIDKKITRKIIKVKAVRYEKFEDIAYIKINSFSQQAYLGVEKALEKLKKKIGKEKLRGLVLDLRNNPGGLLDQAVLVSDAFLDKGKVIVSIKGRGDENDEYVDSEDEKLIPGVPIVILINEGSASASEIVSGALQNNKRAIVMGVKSFGKGSVQTVIPLKKNHGAIKLTTALYYTPNGTSIQAHGIEPNIVVTNAKIEKQDSKGRDLEADLSNHIEVQLQEALIEAKKEQIGDDNFELYEKDYQLARAIDLLRGIDVYKSVIK